MLSQTQREHKMDEKSLYKPNVDFNKQQLQRLQDITCLALGVAAGALGLESLAGVALYLVGMTVSNLSFYVLCCEGKPELFFAAPLREIFVDQVPSGVAGYVMMWCLTYALVK